MIDNLFKFLYNVTIENVYVDFPHHLRNCAIQSHMGAILT